MKTIGNSELIDVWAADGVTIAPSAAKYNAGWTLGEAPPYQLLNALEFEFGSKLNHSLAYGVPAWSNTNEYALGAVTRHANKIWLAILASTNQEPVEGSLFWDDVDAPELDILIRRPAILAPLQGAINYEGTIVVSAYEPHEDYFYGAANTLTIAIALDSDFNNIHQLIDVENPVGEQSIAWTPIATTTFFVMASYTSDGHNSRFSPVTTFSTGTPVILTPTIDVYGAPDRVRNEALITLSPFACDPVGALEYDSTDIEIVRTADSVIVHSVQVAIGISRQYTVPAGVLDPNTEYQFKARDSAGIYVSDFATLTATTREEFVITSFVMAYEGGNKLAIYKKDINTFIILPNPADDPLLNNATIVRYVAAGDAGRYIAVIHNFGISVYIANPDIGELSTVLSALGSDYEYIGFSPDGLFMHAHKPLAQTTTIFAINSDLNSFNQVYLLPNPVGFCPVRIYNNHIFHTYLEAGVGDGLAVTRIDNSGVTPVFIPTIMQIQLFNHTTPESRGLYIYDVSPNGHLLTLIQRPNDPADNCWRMFRLNYGASSFTPIGGLPFFVNENSFISPVTVFSADGNYVFIAYSSPNSTVRGFRVNYANDTFTQVFELNYGRFAIPISISTSEDGINLLITANNNTIGASDVRMWTIDVASNTFTPVPAVPQTPGLVQSSVFQLYYYA